MLLWNGLLVLFVLLAGFPWNTARPQLHLLSLTVKPRISHCDFQNLQYKTHPEFWPSRRQIFKTSLYYKTRLILRGGMAPCGVIFHENVNFLFVAQKCQVIHAFHKTHKQNVIALIETHILGDFINNMVFSDQRVSTKKRRWWAAFSSIFWKIYSHNRKAIYT